MKIIKYAFLCLFLSGCIFGVSKTSTFYTLTSNIQTPFNNQYDAFIGIDKISLPKYMDRPQIVTLEPDGTEVSVSEFNRWIESPSVLCTRALTENLSSLLPKSQVKIRQLGSEKFDRYIWVEVIKMDGTLGKTADLQAWYTIKNKYGKTVLRQKFTDQITIKNTYSDLVNGYSKLWENLSLVIARHLS